MRDLPLPPIPPPPLTPPAVLPSPSACQPQRAPPSIFHPAAVLPSPSACQPQRTPPSLFHQLFPNLAFPEDAPAPAAAGALPRSTTSPALSDQVSPRQGLAATDPCVGGGDPGLHRAGSYAEAVWGRPAASACPQPPLSEPRPGMDAAQRSDPWPRRSSGCAAPHASMAPPAANPGEDLIWHSVKAKYWWQRQPNSARCDGRKMCTTNQTSIPPQRPPSAALQLFNSCTRGRCFKCLASDHRSSTCRNTVRCFGYRRYGHRLRDCRHPRGGRAVPVVQPASVTRVVLGDHRDSGRRRDRTHGVSRRGDTDEHPGFQPHRRRKDLHEEEDGPGQQGRRQAEARPRGRAWQRGHDGRKARSRSPRRRVTGRPSRGGYRHRQLYALPDYEFKFPSLEELKARDTERLQKLLVDFLAPARAWLEDATAKQKQWLQQAENYIGKACLLVDKLNIAAAPLLPRNQAWSGVATVPVSTAMGRILRDLPVHNAANAAASCGTGRDSIADSVEIAEPDSEPAGLSLAPEPAPGGTPGGSLPAAPTLSTLLGRGPACALEPGRDSVQEVEATLHGLEFDAADSVEIADPDSEPTGLSCPDSPLASGAPGGSLPASSMQEVQRCFFSTPSMLLLREAPHSHQPRRRKTYDITNVRRSARLANLPAMPAMKRAQVNLCRHLGLPAEEEGHNSVEQALKEYVAMFDTALPDFAIAALSNLLGVDDEYTKQLDEVLIGMVGRGIDDLIAREGIPAARVAAAV